MANNIGINYLDYMSWTDWMYNLSRYKIGYMMSAATASGSFALNCAYLGIPCIGDKRADTQSILFPDLAVDVFDNEKALKLTFKLKNDLDFYLEVSKSSKFFPGIFSFINSFFDFNYILRYINLFFITTPFKT